MDHVAIPASHLDLVECPPVAALTTLMPDGYPQTSVVWCDFDGEFVRVNTMRGFQKEQNMRRDPRVTLLCYDPKEPLRSLEVRGEVVAMTDPVPDQAGSRRRARRAFSRAVRMSTIVAATIPLSHLDLLTRPICGVFTTLGPDGLPQSSLVWVDFDGECARVNTTLERQKGRNLLADQRVSLLVVDPDNSARYLQVRGNAELVTSGAEEHLDMLTRAYTPHPRFYGFVHPEGDRETETRVICRIHARRVTTNAIHA